MGAETLVAGREVSDVRDVSDVSDLSDLSDVGESPIYIRRSKLL